MSFTISPTKPLIPSHMNLAFLITHTSIRPTFSPPLPKIPKLVKIRPPAAGFQLSNSRRIPAARDRVIEFGKYRGRMLGSLPSSYLEWISENLRSGDTEEWAKLSDQVLRDPVYRDRIEWEMAEKVLSGGSPGSTGDGSNAVKELLEISERFGWDNEDKIGWSRVDFGLLGTTMGGRIPRVKDQGMKGEKVKALRETKSSSDGDGGRRRERIERARRRRVERTSDGGIGEKEEMENYKGDDDDDYDDEDGVRFKNRFPGREAFLNNVLNRRRFY